MCLRSISAASEDKGAESSQILWIATQDVFQAIQIFLGPSCSVCLGDGMMTVYCVLTVWSLVLQKVPSEGS